MKRTANFHDQIADPGLAETAGVVDNGAPLDATVDMLDAHAAAGDASIRGFPETATGSDGVQPDVADAGTGVLGGGHMKVAILAGGVGTRLAEETEIKPKPMVEIGGKPILWHIMMHYACYGFKEFIIALGYKGEYIKKYTVDYCSLNSNLTVNLSNGKVDVHNGNGQLQDWTVHLIDTGQATLTGGRIKRLSPYLGNTTFMLTWGDGVSNVNLHKLVDFHRSHGKLATVTAVRPPARFGRIEIQWEQVVEFSEKPQLGEGWINGAFFVLEPGIFDYIEGDDTQWEREPMERLAKDGQLMAYCHEGFWQCMDTLRDKKLLNDLWERGNPPWKMWE